MKVYTIVLRHSMYGDTPISGEFEEELPAKAYHRGAEAMYDMVGRNQPFEKVVLVETDLD